MTDKASDALLAEVIEHYLGSRDFNGLSVGFGDSRSAAAGMLIREGSSKLSARLISQIRTFAHGLVVIASTNRSPHLRRQSLA